MSPGNKVPNLTYCPTVLVVRYGLRPGGGGVCWTNCRTVQICDTAGAAEILKICRQLVILQQDWRLVLGTADW